MKQIYTALLLLIIPSIILTGQNIRINELMAINNNVITDNYGNYSDWIEIKNTGTTVVDLGGMYITDNLFFPFTWQLPLGNDSTKIQPGSFLILWADGNTNQGVLHVGFQLSGGGEQVGLFNSSGNIIDTVSFGQQVPNISFGRFPDGASNWVYFAQSTPGTTNASNYLTASNYQVALPNSAGFTQQISLYSNISWTLSNPVSWISVSPGSGSNNGTVVITTTEANTTGTDRTTLLTLSGASLADQQIEVIQYGSPSLPKLVINELMADNLSFIADPSGQFDDWFEIYNYGSTPVNIGGFFLTDDLGEPTRYQVPADDPSETTIPPYGFMLVWADGNTGQGPLHTNFSLSKSGEQIGLFLNQFTAIDTVIFSQQYSNISYGRTWDASPGWTYFNVPTPGYSNALDIAESDNGLIKIWPNPAAEYLHFTSSTPVGNIEILDFTGRVVFSQILDNTFTTIPVSSMTPGVYLFRYQSTVGTSLKKFVLAR
jgi:hypothetical protein